MRDFTFVFENQEPVMDFKTGLRMPMSFTVSAPDYETALAKMAAHGAELGWSDDLSDYLSDIEEGNVRVLLPTRID